MLETNEPSKAPDVRKAPLQVLLVPAPAISESEQEPPSPGEYDVDTKVREYQRRGDLEIWRIHPYERTLTAWRRQPDGSYTASTYGGGIVHPVALPNVAIDLDALFG